MYSIQHIFGLDREPKQARYSTTYVSKLMHALENQGNIKFRRFLRDNGLLQGDLPASIYLDKGYFIVEGRRIKHEKEWVPTVKVTPEGIQFILELEKQLLNETK